jgi:hypothetical protein
MSTRRQRVKVRGRVARAVRSGALPRVSALRCADCGGPARDYDHHLGYDDEHALDVVALCRRCHARRGVERGEWPRGDRAWQRLRPELVARGERSPTARLKVSDVLAIRAAAAAGDYHHDIAPRFGVSRAQVGRIVRRERWASVGEQGA